GIWILRASKALLLCNQPAALCVVSFQPRIDEWLDIGMLVIFSSCCSRDPKGGVNDTLHSRQLGEHDHAPYFSQFFASKKLCPYLGLSASTQLFLRYAYA